MKKKAEEKDFCLNLAEKPQCHVTKEKSGAPMHGRISLLIFGITLAACSIVRTTTDRAAQIALETVGVKIPESSPQDAPQKTIRMRLDAAKDLNADDDGKGLSAIVRVYKLKDRNAFLSAPYAVFGHPDREKQAFGTDLLDVRELTLAPGQRLDLAEKMTGEMTHLGVVTLFHSPDRKRWRFAFTAAAAEAPGITLGVHACAMTATSVAPSGMTLSDTALLSSVKCN